MRIDGIQRYQEREWVTWASFGWYNPYEGEVQDITGDDYFVVGDMRNFSNLDFGFYDPGALEWFEPEYDVEHGEHGNPVDASWSCNNLHFHPGVLTPRFYPSRGVIGE